MARSSSWSTAGKVCKDCIADAEEHGAGLKLAPPKRAAPHPGPRCATHWREEKKRRSKAAHGKRIENAYGISQYAYNALYEAQGRKCALCQRATGARKRLAVDHDHKTGEVRGLLCGPCNRDIIGRSGDNPEFFDRAADYLRNPPARKVLNAQTD